ncbi:hypothetical protein R3W88_029378 [Solanum pinnatisectum]|uniref:CID domain-containing protein n=1 Tax=Solanum pinnatisectum TaxID=50273 RepID=A0AAV9K5L5_9SOLN|nr:hypothetical protein R3W88_029378 [Solanum pinnatisectum]
MIREKQEGNPAYNFLFSGEGNYYYRYNLNWMATRPPGGPFNAPFPSSSLPMISSNAVGSAAMLGSPHLHQPPFPPFYEQQPSQHFGRADYDHSHKSFKGLSRPLSSDVEIDLTNVLNSLNGTNESIKGAKNWFMQRSPFIPALVKALKGGLFSLDDSERQLHIVYLANDILFESLQRRINSHELDNEALAFKPILGPMLARIYHNPQNKEENQSRLQKILQFWGSKEVYDQDTIRALENEMMSGLPTNFAGLRRELLAADPSAGAECFTVDEQVPPLPNLANQDKVVLPIPSADQFHPGVVLPTGFPGSMPMLSSAPQGNLQAAVHPMPTSTAKSDGKLPPDPGLIPGMVRKMQIGSGVPYSPMSPLDMPTIIPPSTVSESEILERVSKFFREIGEVNPSEGPVKPSDLANDYDDYEREPHVRKGGACIPPPSNLHVEPEIWNYSDGSVEQKPGLNSSGRLGLGATVNPDKSSQYDDVYTSYRKERSINYHSSMSARTVR